MARILIIDDDPGVRALLRAVLEGAGYQVAEESDGNRGVKRYRREGADLVITDMLMPEKDGIEVITELRHHNPQVKVVAISGGGRGLDAVFNLDMAQEFGALHTIAKPFSPFQVLEAVDKLLEIPGEE
ncbi:MAG: response regulator [Magnetococcales bacterium]|nr:response regulator [Magnetococcales bacterium]